MLLSAFFSVHRRLGLALICALLAVALGFGASADAPRATLRPDFGLTTLTDALTRATTMAFAPDGRLFISEQDGALRVYKDGALLAEPAITLPVNSIQERGLLGIAFDPAFVSNSYIYLFYTTDGTNGPIRNRVSRFTMTGDTVNPDSELPLINSEPLEATNHNGGALQFGKDGKLYITIGENAVTTNSQKLTNLLGKVLRINPDGSIPTDNPFYTQAKGKRRAIWALGLRNPYTIDIQRVTGRMFINDVGAALWEEVNLGRRGGNYGWPATEGKTNNPQYISPLYVYGHGEGCSIAGAAFYNPAELQFPVEYVGDFFFADYCAQWIRVMDVKSRTVAEADFASELPGNPVDLRVGPDGALYVLMRDRLARIDYDGPSQGDDLLVNGGFEADATTPQGWTALSLTNDRVMCDQTQQALPVYVSDEGECAFRFFGRQGKNARLTQTVDGAALNVGDVLTLSAVVHASELRADAGRLRARVTYTDDTTDVIVLTFRPGTYGFSGYVSQPLALEKPVASILVTAAHRGARGRMTLDRVRLQVASGTALSLRGN